MCGEFVDEIAETEIKVVPEFRRQVIPGHAADDHCGGGDGADGGDDGFGGGEFGFS